jgi:hypothetical protein
MEGRSISFTGYVARLGLLVDLALSLLLHLVDAMSSPVIFGLLQVGGFVSSWNLSPELHDLFATARPIWIILLEIRKVNVGIQHRRDGGELAQLLVLLPTL